MSEERKGGFGMDKGGFGARKPKATFGDVMLGIPAGRGGEREERGGRAQRPRTEAPARVGVATAANASESPARSPSTPTEARRGPRRVQGGRKPAEKKVQGPLVVVKRASGAIETRPLDGPREVSAKKDMPSGENSGALTEEPAPLASNAETSHGPSDVESQASLAGDSSRVVPVVSRLHEEAAEPQSFAELYEQSAKHETAQARRHFRVGEKVEGKIFQLGAATAFVTLGSKSEALIDLRELVDEEGILRFGVGDTVSAYIVEAGAKGIILSKQLGKGSASLAMLAEARASGMPVEGLVLAVNKGGLEVAVGEARAFCPSSQVDVRFVGKLESFVGEKHRFRVIEVRDRKVVLSRRALLEEEQKIVAAKTREGLVEGKVLKGKVTSVREFGAFVDLGGIEGLVPVAELSFGHVGHPSELVNSGDEVEVEVLKIEAPDSSSPDKAKHKERITLSIRSRQEDPWKAVLAEVKEGDRLSGKVVRLVPFGAFVELRPGVDGLIHVSALSNRRVAHPRDVVKVGESVQVQVEKVEPAERRIGLRRVVDEEVVPAGDTKVPSAPRAEHPRPRVHQLVTGAIDRIESYGVFVAFPGGKGLVPASETGTERGTDMKRTFQMGQELTAEIIDIDASGKIRLSLTAAQRSVERAEMTAWKQSQPKGGGGKGFGTFADLLKNRKE